MRHETDRVASRTVERHILQGERQRALTYRQVLFLPAAKVQRNHAVASHERTVAHTVHRRSPEWSPGKAVRVAQLHGVNHVDINPGMHMQHQHCETAAVQTAVHTRLHKIPAVETIHLSLADSVVQRVGGNIDEQRIAHRVDTIAVGQHGVERGHMPSRSAKMVHRVLLLNHRLVVEHPPVPLAGEERQHRMGAVACHDAVVVEPDGIVARVGHIIAEISHRVAAAHVCSHHKAALMARQAMAHTAMQLGTVVHHHPRHRKPQAVRRREGHRRVGIAIPSVGEALRSTDHILLHLAAGGVAEMLAAALKGEIAIAEMPPLGTVAVGQRHAYRLPVHRCKVHPHHIPVAPKHIVLPPTPTRLLLVLHVARAGDKHAVIAVAQTVPHRIGNIEFELGLVRQRMFGVLLHQRIAQQQQVVPVRVHMQCIGNGLLLGTVAPVAQPHRHAVPLGHSVQTSVGTGVALQRIAVDRMPRHGGQTPKVRQFPPLRWVKRRTSIAYHPL